MKEVKLKENVGVIGVYRLVFERKDGEKRVVEIKNKITDKGLEFLTKAPLGLNDAGSKWLYIALGDDGTSASAGDTALKNEVYRGMVSSRNRIGNKSLASLFIPYDEANFTIEEIGIFIDGNENADTGDLFSRIASADVPDLPVSKNNQETLTIEYKLEFVLA